MELFHQAAVRRPDRLGIGAGGEAQDRISLVRCHVGAAAGGRRWRAGPRPGDIVMPVGMDSVEISLDETGALLVLGAALPQQGQEIFPAAFLQPPPAKAAPPP